MATAGDVFVVSASGSSHIFPCIELCTHLSSRKYTTTLVLSSTDASAVSPSRLGPISAVVEVASPPRGKSPAEGQFGVELEAHLSAKSTFDVPGSSSTILCAVIDFPMGWIKPIFWKFNIPVVTLFTFSACAASMELGAWKSRCGDVNPNEIGLIDGLPQEMNITHMDCARRPRTTDGRGGGGGGGGGPPRPGDQPPWIALAEGSAALMFNTYDDLERPFMDYLIREMALPVWGVGPLLPSQFWHLSNNGSDDQLKLKQWLDTKHEKSVLYIAFGSQVSPTMEETFQLACALEETSHPFIWVVKNSDIEESERSKFEAFCHKIHGKGLVIRGWAPQLFILNHSSTGGFLSHCGWNSTLEAIGHGVPVLAWPIRGDQMYNAKLVVHHLKVGFMASTGVSLEISKNDILGGIEKVMGDDEVRARADALGAKLRVGFPESSNFTLNGLGEFLRRNQKNYH